jgi:hypothetical protein
VSEENGDTRSPKEIRLMPFFNTHACLQQLTRTLQVESLKWQDRMVLSFYEREPFLGYGVIR